MPRFYSPKSSSRFATLTFLSRDQTGIFQSIRVQIASIGLSVVLLTPSGPTTSSMWLYTFKNLGLVI